MSERKQNKTIEVKITDPNLDHKNWSEDESNDFYGLIATLLKIDMRLNPLLYKKPTTSESYESNQNIRNPNHTSQSK